MRYLWVKFIFTVRKLGDPTPFFSSSDRFLQSLLEFEIIKLAEGLNSIQPVSSDSQLTFPEFFLVVGLSSRHSNWQHDRPGVNF